MNFTNKTTKRTTIRTAAMFAVTVVLGAVAVLTFSLAQNAHAAAATGKEIAAAQLRTQAARLETRADQLEEQGANAQLVQIILQRNEDLRDRADILDPSDGCPTCLT
jgi:hypothetical protein